MHLMTEGKVWNSKRTEIALVLILLIFASFRLYHSNIHLFPSHVHAWTQSDRYAITVGYVENGMNLLLPSTLNLSPKYPPKTPIAAQTGITKADLPLAEYISAVVMKLSGQRQPIVHRLVILVFGLVGLVFLFLAFRSVGASFAMALLIVAFAMFSPVHAYYLNGFIPSIPALSLCFVALWFFVKHQKSKHIIDFALAIAFAALAAMIRPPFLIFLLSIAVSQALIGLIGKSGLRPHLLLLLAALVVFGALQWHNHYLSTHYGSLFITGFQQASGFSEAWELLGISIAKWYSSYFSYTQYLILVFAGLLLLAYRRQIIHSAVFPVLLVAVLFLFGSLLYFFAMARQFPDHDYYFLDSFFMPLLLIAAAGLSFPKPDTLLRKGIHWIVVISVMVMMFDAAAKELENRYVTHSWDRTEQTRLLFEDSKEFLDVKGVAPDAKLLVLDAYTTNVPLLLMHRKGFTVINTNAGQLTEALDHSFDYVVIPNRTLASDVLRNLPSLQMLLQPIANNGKIGLFTIQNGQNKRTAFEMVLPMIVEDELFRPADSLLCTGNEREYVILAEGELLMDPDFNYAVFFDAESHHTDDNNQLQLVMDLQGSHQKGFYDAFPLHSFFNTETSPVAFLNIPDHFSGSLHLKCYLWNPSTSDVCLSKPRIYILKYANK